MTTFLAYTIIGIATGCIYALTASGLVVTYTTSGIFNFAHGAIGMVCAFTYWELTVDHGWNQILGLIVVLGIVAPVLGAVIHILMMRGLHGTTIGTQLVVTLGLLLALIGFGQVRWNPTEPRVLPEFFAGNTVRLFSVNVTYHQVTMIIVAVLVAVFLRLLFVRTRIGIAMRAVVDDPELASLNGVAPDAVSMASWAIGSIIAGTAGILLAPIVSLDVLLLTLLVINGYAAAMVGRLRSLPWTFAGGVALGLAEAYTIWQLPTDVINKLKPGLPIIFLYVVLLILPQARLSAGRLVTTRRVPRVATRRESIVGAVSLIIGAVIFVQLPFAEGSLLVVMTQGLVFSLIMLSLVLLVGYAGQTSLAQMTFVGLGAFAMGKFFGGASLWGILLAALISGAVGALAALPALRLQGLYLALSTFAFAQGMSTIFFKHEDVFGFGGRLAVGRPHVLGVSFESDKMFFVLVATVFALAGVSVLAVRRGPFGRRLVAMKDSSAACATLGLNLTFTKLAVFALSAAIAGIAGCFFGGVNGQVGPNDFEPLNSLVVLLLVSIAGISTVTGAFMGGLTFGLFKYQKFLNLFPASTRGNFPFIGAGLGAIGIGRNPNGWTSEFKWLGDIVHRVLHPGSRDDVPTAAGDQPGPVEEVRELAGTAS